MTSKLVPPGGFLMPLSTAAKELGLEEVDLLEYAEELDGLGAPLRVCVMVPGNCLVMPYPTPLAEPAGMKPADRRFAFIDPLANTVDDDSGPGFFRRLATKKGVTLGAMDILSMVDGSGMVWADGIEVRLEDLWVPREDIEALKMREAEELSAKRAETLLKIIGALARLVASFGHKKLGTDDDPNVRAIAAELASDMPGGSPIEGTIANKLNEGLAALNAIGKQKGRKKGRKPGQEAE